MKKFGIVCGISDGVTFHKNVEVATDNLNYFYEVIGCSMIDCVYLKGYDIWVDDEGLLKSGSIVGQWMVGDALLPPLAGNIVITKAADAEGNTVFFEEGDELPEVNLINILGVVR